jgi:serine/threonine protein kinase
MDSCPSPDELRRFRDGELGDVANTTIATHINRCPTCQEWLDDDRSSELADELLAAKVVFPSTEGNGTSADVGTASTMDPDTTAPLSPRMAERIIALDDTIPDRIGGYKVVARIGGGGQAELFRVGDPLLARELALKLGRKPIDADSPADRDELVREARTLASLSHTGLVNVYALGFLDDGRPYLVIDLVLGANLEDHVGAGRLEPRRAAEVVEQLAGVVAYLHARGIVHQDIKPRNVMIDEHGRPRLIDLGLARLRYAWASEPEFSSGGTPAYLSPEQAQGEYQRIGPATDVFGLGGILFFSLTGGALYKGANHNQVITLARRGEYDARSLQDAAAPEKLKQICARALALDPADRHPSAADLAGELKGFLEEDAKPKRSGEKSRRVILMASALGVSVVLGALGAMALHFPGRNEPDAGKGGPGLPTAVAPSLPSILRFEISHFPKLDATHFDPTKAGVLGRNSFAVREDDEVIVRANLSEPAYSYLIAFRPDGTDELCDPDDEDAPPSRKRQPLYPPPAKSDERYRLTEGAGLHAFALVISREPLPSYREWKRRVGPIPWTARVSGEPGIVWLDDGQGLQPLLADDIAGTRGKGFKGRGSGEPAAKLANWLRKLPGVDLVALEAFPVEPAAGP